MRTQADVEVNWYGGVLGWSLDAEMIMLPAI
jgi:hypothetical protein